MYSRYYTLKPKAVRLRKAGKTYGEIKKILGSLNEDGETILLIEHDMNFVMNISDTVIVLNEGKVLKIGKPKDVVKDKKVLEAYLGK